MTNMATAPKPLAGIRVLDLSNVLAGPFCCHQLAYMGAEVIKVEMPGRGDLARQLGADAELNSQLMGVSFLAQNAGKKSITLNLKHPQSRYLLDKLLASAQVLVENFRPGVMRKLGLDYASLSGQHPELIYCAISGFGQDGEWSQRPAYDQIVQGLSGLMTITGAGAETPMRTGFPVADTIGGMTAACAICAALNARPRGAYIDVSMLEALLTSMGWVLSNYLLTGVEPQAHGNENVTSAPSGSFRTASGMLNIAANKEEQWQRLAQHLQRADLLTNPKYSNREQRKRNRVELRAELERSLSHKSAEQWEQELNALGVPAGAVLGVAEVVQRDQISQRGMLADFNIPQVSSEPVQLPTTGFKFDSKPLRVENPPPTLGAHNQEIWGELLSEAEFESLRTQGAL